MAPIAIDTTYRMEGDALLALPIDWGSDALKLLEDDENGDQCVVKPIPLGALVGVVDGIGHGKAAAAAAEGAIGILGAHASQPLVSLLNLCHEKLQGTRGVVMALASFNAKENTVTWIGIGNVQAVLHRADRTAVPLHEHMVMSGGVVGDRLPLLRAATVRIAPGDTLVIATDGISDTFADVPALMGSPGGVAHKILSRHAKKSDDALVLVARYKGAGS
jgi:serine/threonine protein phosphatase PrpC